MKELEYPFEAEKILAKRKSLRRSLKEQEISYHAVKIAIVGGSTTKDIRDILELFLLNYGIEPVFYEGEYNRFYEELVFDNQELEAFGPDIVYIHTTNRNVYHYPEPEDSEAAVKEKLQLEYERYQSIWSAVKTKYHCSMIQNNFEMPYYRNYGNMDAVDIHGCVNFLNALNQRLYEYARNQESFYICDINYLSADYGLSKWAEPKYFYLYKYAVSPKAIPYLAYNLANIIKSMYGKNKKCIALDLDNTLWGGIIAEDGVENIVIGKETPEGEMYTAFQQYLKEKQKLGTLLTIASKNELKFALDGLAREDMLLHKEDFAVIKANYEPKSQNVIETAKELNLLPESFVFVDDNPAEQMIVKDTIPKASVVSAENIEEVIYLLDRGGFFEPTKVTADDLQRAQMYQKEQLRKELESTCTDYESYLKSLEMVTTIRPFDAESLGRITQLTNKSNQFNLTTRRYTQAELAEIADNAEYITLYGRLKDKFGDNGIVSVIITKKAGEAYVIDLWLMSCRVLKRNMEYAMFDALVAEAKKRGVKKLQGVYIPTEKNGMVKEFYRELGFNRVEELENMATKWEYMLS